MEAEDLPVLAVALALTTVVFVPSVSGQSTLVVDDDGAECPNAGFTNIQWAVENASAGDTVEVCAGIYEETVTVDKTLTLLGPQAGIDARDRSGSEATVQAVRLNADQITLNGFRLDRPSCQEGPGIGIETSPSNSGYKVVNNIVEGYSRGAETPSSGQFETVYRFNLFRDNDCGSPAGLLSGFDPQNPLNNAVIDKNKFVGHTEGGASFAVQLVNGGSHNDVTISNNTMEASIVLCDADSVVIEGNAIEMNDPDSSTAVFICGGVDGLDIVDNVLDGTERGIWIAPNFFGAPPNSGFEILDNEITGNPTAGIQVAEDRHDGVLPVHFNVFSDNGLAVNNTDADQPVDAIHNWWGSPAGPTFSPVPSNTVTGDGIAGNVTFTPWCAVSSCQANVLVHGLGAHDTVRVVGDQV